MIKINPANRQHGITLIEILVSLLIFSACMALVSSVAVQVSGVLSKVQQNNQSSMASFVLQHQVLDSAFQKAVVGRNGQPGNFNGTPSELTFQTDAHPLRADFLNTSFKLSVDVNSDGLSRLMLDDPAVPLSIYVNPSALKFVYFDEALRLHNQWPPSGVERPAKLPRVVRVQDSQQRVVSQWVLLGPKHAHPYLGFNSDSFAGGSN